MRQGAAAEAPAAAPAHPAAPATSGLHMSGPRLNLNLPSRSGPAHGPSEAGLRPGSHGGTGEQERRQGSCLTPTICASTVRFVSKCASFHA